MLLVFLIVVLTCTYSHGNNICSFSFFYDSGPSETSILPNQVAGKTFGKSLKLKAVKNNGGVCTALFSGDKAINLSQENVKPTSTGLKFSVSGNNIANYSASNAASTSTNLTFTNGIAPIPQPIYHDAGRIRLHANYNVAGVNVSGSSNAFWVSPAKLVVEAKAGNTILNAAIATATPNHKAGEDFTLTVKAYNGSSPAVITKNYLPGQIQLKLTRTGPKSKVSVDGNLSYATTKLMSASTSPVFKNVTLTNFSAGVSTYKKAQYSEVGLLRLKAQDSAYGDGTMKKIDATAIDIGRFTPAYFIQKIAKSENLTLLSGDLTSNCTDQGTQFAYSGQIDSTNNNRGTIRYLTHPVLEITAHNKDGFVTKNYVDEYMKLTNSGVKIDASAEKENSQKGVDDKYLEITSYIQDGTLTEKGLGILHYRLSGQDRFFYNRSGNALVKLFPAKINFSVNSITDNDSIAIAPTANAKQDVVADGVNIMFGRLLLENSYGPETSNLVQPMQLQHFNGKKFINSATNDCVSYDKANMKVSKTENKTSLEPTSIIGGKGDFVSGNTHALSLKAPGAGKQGELKVTYNSEDWLKYDWDNGGSHDDYPSAIATFGVFRGNDRIISWREVFNN